MNTRLPAFLLITLGAWFVAASSGTGAGDWPGGSIVDMSYSYNADTIYWPTEKGFRHRTEFAGVNDKGYYYSAYEVTTAEHGGTHLDAPIHFAEGAQSTDEVPLERLVGSAVVIDVRSRTVDDRDYQILPADVTAWESEYGRIPDGAIVLFRTGWGQYWPDRKSYMGTAETGAAAVAKLHFPGIHPQTAALLATERNINSVGIDTASIDYGQSADFMTHRILCSQNIPGFENVANLEQLPATGARVVALPMKIEGGSGGPLRIIALLP
jgi:kynurenine formamidase